MIIGRITIPAEIKTFTYDLVDNCKYLTNIAVEEDNLYLYEENDIFYSADNAADIKNESSVIHYTDNDDILFKLKSYTEATVVKSTITFINTVYENDKLTGAE